MSLTPVAPTGSGSVSGGLPSHAPGARFATEQACREYLARLRWGQEFVCPACDGTEAWPTARGLWMCAACGHQASVIAGTIFQGTRTPLSVWFRAIWWVVSQKNGASALGLQRVLGLGSYRTAWTWLHKLRRAMVRPGRDRVSEEVEVDETLVGGLEAGGGRRHLGKKALVVIAAEVRGRAIGRIRMQRVADASADSLLTFVQHAVQPGSVVITDGLQSYRRLPKRGYRHDRRVLLGRGESGRGGLASRPPGRVAPQALAPGYASGRRQSRASRLLPRRVHLSVQSTNLTPSREALPSAPGTGRGGGSRSLRGDGQGYPWSEEETPPQPVVGT